MKSIGTGQTIGDLKQRITFIEKELKEISNHAEPMPELINSSNLLRQNEYLTKINEKNTALVLAYREYSSELQKMLSTVFEIQNDLKEVLKSQSTLIKSSRSKSNKKTRRKKK